MMPKLKPLGEQIIVLTGATSGIGLVTARRAADAGARLVIAARNEDALRQLAQELRDRGSEAVYVVADVGREEDVRRISNAAMERFGGFDTWINDAAVAIYGKVEDVSIEDQRRLFETNYWGVVYGSRIACEHLRRRGGKLINLGSALSERAIPIQGVYSASKAAVMGFTDALRMELEQDKAPVSVTLIKPGAIDTPYKDHAGNYLDVAAKNPPPVYAPDAVATAILYTAEHHTRDVVVGAGGKMVTVLGNVAPRLSDKVMGRLMPLMQRTKEPQPGIRKGSLYEPGEDLHERGGYAMTFDRSLYSTAVRHKFATAAVALGTVAVLYGLSRTGDRQGRIGTKLRRGFRSDRGRPMPAAEAGTAHQAVALAKELLALDHGAATVYQAAVRRVSDPAIRQELQAFHKDHERHIRALEAWVRARGEEPAADGSAATLPQRETLVEGLESDRLVLEAMRENADATDAAYERAAARAMDPELHQLVMGHLQDEVRHRSRLVERLKQIGTA